MPSPLRKIRDRERKETTRRRLLDAAASLFATKGYHHTLVSDIVAAAGVGQGTFYRAFKDKRDVFTLLQAELFDELLQQFSAMRAHPPTELAAYRRASLAAARRLASVLVTRRDVALMLLREAPSIDRDAEQEQAQLLDRFADVAAFYLDRAIEQGFARPCNSAVVAQSLVGMGLRHIHRWFEGGYAGVELDDLVSEVVDFAFLGFAPRNDGETP